MILLAVSPLFCLSSNESKGVKITPEFEALVKVAPLKPAKATAFLTPGVLRMISEARWIPRQAASDAHLVISTTILCPGPMKPCGTILPIPRRAGHPDEDGERAEKQPVRHVADKPGVACSSKPWLKPLPRLRPNREKMLWTLWSCGRSTTLPVLATASARQETPSQPIWSRRIVDRTDQRCRE